MVNDFKACEEAQWMTSLIKTQNVTLWLRTIKTPEACKAMQVDLGKLQLWSETWKIKFNVSKCVIAKISK